ncbi:hypothetical protein [Bartonella massiliensis]|uniref:hypothetical protein n=1 Tax=Bartonella massiliensis TaxID=929795 RepID=UPI00115ADFFA|nr:hypothetical protein [Bartonella massiliensis]
MGFRALGMGIEAAGGGVLARRACVGRILMVAFLEFIEELQFLLKNNSASFSPLAMGLLRTHISFSTTIILHTAGSICGRCTSLP